MSKIIRAAPPDFTRPAFRLAGAFAVLAFLLAAAPGVRAQTPFYLGAHLAGHRLAELDQSRLGYGFRLGYEAYLPFISLETEVNFFPTSSGGDLGETQAFFGLKFGKHIGRWGGFLKFRPGLTHFGGGAFQNRLTERTKFALDMGGGVEFDLSEQLLLRLDVSDARIFYGDARILPAPPPGGPPGPRLGTHDTLQSTFGIVLRF
jgi:hypothetical protein